MGKKRLIKRLYYQHFILHLKFPSSLIEHEKINKKETTSCGAVEMQDNKEVHTGGLDSCMIITQN